MTMELGECHRPVMLDEAIEGLAVKPEGVYVDATFGRGSHARAILDQLTPQGKLVVFDKDPQAILEAKKLAMEDSRVTVFHASFSEIESCLSALKLVGRVDGLLMDLGVSSPQLEEASRGFSFLRDGPLDMRMDTTSGESAAEWLAHVKESELADVLFKFGEEPFSKRIAAAIVAERKKEAILTTGQLAGIIKTAHPRWNPFRHPATKSFQAIRIFINRELEDLTVCLNKSLNVLAKGGRLVVISFHSLEDRIVKRFIQEQVRGDFYPAKVPVRDVERHARLKSMGKGLKPQPEEVVNNVRSRSAMLRIAEKI